MTSVLHIGDSTYRASSPFSLDVARRANRLLMAALTEARGESLVDHPDFGDWSEQERRQLRAEWAAAVINETAIDSMLAAS